MTQVIRIWIISKIISFDYMSLILLKTTKLNILSSANCKKWIIHYITLQNNYIKQGTQQSFIINLEKLRALVACYLKWVNELI